MPIVPHYMTTVEPLYSVALYSVVFAKGSIFGSHVFFPSLSLLKKPLYKVVFITSISL